MTAKDPQTDVKRRSIAADGPLLAVVQRLTERGIIKPDEAGDMLALLSAISGGSPQRLPARLRQSADGSEPKRHRLPNRIDRLL